MSQSELAPPPADQVGAYAPPASEAEPKSLPLTRKIDVSATWELELLISGLVIVALMQLPGVLDGFFESRIPHAIGGARMALVGLQLYTKAMAFALIGAFILHLFMRAYWVGLIGLNSVFPNGPRWDQMRYGPIGRSVYQERFKSLPSVNARVDDICSVTFPFAWLLIVLVALSVTMGAVFGGGTYLITKYLLHGKHGQAVFAGFVFVFALAPLALMLIDRKVGAKLDPQRGGARLRKAIAVASSATGLRVYGPIMFTLFSNVPKKVIYPIFYLAFFGILGVSFTSIMVRRGVFEVNAYDYFAQSQSHGVNARYYETQRQEDHAFDVVPMIQSDIVTDPYVRLFIPYSPARSNPWLARRCAGVPPLVRRGVISTPDWAPDSTAEKTLACLASVFALQVNGRPRPDLELRFYEHPRLGLRGVLAYVPTDSLPRGRNDIVVRRIPSIGETGKVDSTGTYVIPFWK